MGRGTGRVPRSGPAGLARQAPGPRLRSPPLRLCAAACALRADRQRGLAGGRGRRLPLPRRSRRRRTAVSPGPRQSAESNRGAAQHALGPVDGDDRRRGRRTPQRRQKRSDAGPQVQDPVGRAERQGLQQPHAHRVQRLSPLALVCRSGFRVVGGERPDRLRRPGPMWHSHDDPLAEAGCVRLRSWAVADHRREAPPSRAYGAPCRSRAQIRVASAPAG